MSDNVKTVAQALRAASKVLVATHVNPDGDGLGCEAALVRGLRAAGKQAYIVNQDKAAPRYDILRLEELAAPEGEGGWDLAVTLDAPVLHRIGTSADKVMACPKVVKIDHHVSDDTFGHVNWIDSKAAATGEMMVELFEEMGWKPDADMATGMYYAIVHDTGCFRYSNTTDKTLRYAASLKAAGANSFEITTAMFDTRPLGAIKLAGEVLGKIRMLADGRGVLGTVSLEQLKACGATKDDTEDLVESMRSIEGVEVSAFLREDAPGQVKASFRSKRDTNVREVAEVFDGGGHDKAAGATLRMPLDEAAEKVAAEVEKKLG